ncbi:hypothetical protein CKAH01_16725 [Colletotrichum kahawae]|uniref:Uncharacterized protein n=1 Tax=Colletotrichum kahawae TaxID=34407 RepID=A0AAD9YGF9_COLKA|nr:hypothetical protein CKAH01_16725 [Colletotrichum kahawae]
MRLEACATTLSTTSVGHLNRGQSHHGPFSICGIAGDAYFGGASKTRLSRRYLLRQTNALHDVNQIQEATNSNAVAKFQNFVQQSPESQRIQALQQEVNTLRSAASITTAVLDERDKHRLNSPQAFDGTGHL